jgi:hypothetical protein
VRSGEREQRRCAIIAIATPGTAAVATDAPAATTLIQVRPIRYIAGVTVGGCSFANGEI